MFRNEYINEIRQTINYLREKQQSLTYALAQREELQRLLDRVETQISKLSQRIEKTKETRGDKTKLNSALDLAIKILTEHGATALQTATGKEFDMEIYTTPFFQALSDPKIFNIKFNTKTGAYSVKINLGLVAGRARDYATAVKAARTGTIGQSRNVKAKRNGIPLASWFWREKYYGPAREDKEIPQPKYITRLTPTGKKKKPRVYNTQAYKDKYFATIAARAAAFGENKAPWWEILNYGYVRFKPLFKDGNVDQVPYPTPKATRFVERAEEKIREKLNSSKSETKLNDEMHDLQVSKKKLIEAINYTNEVIYRLQNLPDDVNDRPDRELVQSLIERQLGARLSRADRNKIEALVTDLQLGVAKPRTYLGNDVRVGTLNIQRILRSRNQ